MIIGLTLTGLAALLHVFIFWLESFAWTTPRARAVFGTTEAEAAATKQLALNQGFYNLFLALMVASGVVLTLSGQSAAGIALVLAGAGSMAAASLVLLCSDRSKTAAALKQGTAPAVGVVAVLLSFFI